MLMAWLRFEISIHTPLAGSDHRRQRPHDHIRISIHTPLAGSDHRPPQRSRRTHISIHTPLAGSDLNTMCGASVSSTFQSTLPLRGATGNQQTMQFADIFQSTLSVRRATVSIVRRRAAHCSFQSTLSVRRATSATNGPCKWPTYFNPRSP